MIRNFLLGDCDWTQMPDAVLSTELKAQWTTYRAKLRSLPQDYDGQDADDVKFPINPLMYATFISLKDVNGDDMNAGKAYLDTIDQFGSFTAATYGEYAKRIVMTIASNYKIKNPDVIFAPANISDQYVETQDELDALLKKIQENNV